MIFQPSFGSSQIPLSEYPRPQFERKSYFPLNGIWQYAITATADVPASFDGDILVPFSPESRLSGVSRALGADEFLHYRRTFTLPENFNRGRVIINFGACDQCCTVFCNGREAGRHEGGYLPFSMEITEFLTDNVNEISLVVTDDASSHIYGRGKQSYERGGIWYTAVSGIWQSVWLESVPLEYISGLNIFPDGINKRLGLRVQTVGGHEKLSCRIYDGEKLMYEFSDVPAGRLHTFDVPECKLWSPQSPELYRLVITCGGDVVYSYFGLRTFSRIQLHGRHFIALNGQPVFQSGLLDQGYWGEGIYTPATNRSMYDCLKKVKSLGFNMLRKHIKVEPFLWYYYCDILGIFVWQDMVNGGARYPKWRLNLGPFIDLHLNDADYASMGRGDERSRAQYIAEAEGTVRALFNSVSLCLWTPFNVGWGQFDCLKIEERLRAIDGTRLYDHASGWQDMGGGDVCSKHVYFKKVRLKNDNRRALALTEFGGYSFAEGERQRSFGYRKFKTRQKFTSALTKLYEREVVPAIRTQYLCATVYTQLADVEDEINGIFTSDMRCKVDEGVLKQLNRRLYEAFAECVGGDA